MRVSRGCERSLLEEEREAPGEIRESGKKTELYAYSLDS